MTEVERITEQYDRALQGGAWHGDSVWEILRDIPAEQAFWRPLPAVHTIWELVMHMAFWETEVCRRLQKLSLPPEETMNFPTLPEPTSENWQHALDTLRNSNVEFRRKLLELHDAELDRPLSRPTYTVYVEVHGVIQHHLYHAGQIAMLRKSLAAD